MSGFFKYAMKPGNNTIGKKVGDKEPNVVVAGVGIAPEQCILDFSEDDRRCTIIPNSEDMKKYRVMVNGEVVEAPLLLEHGDRVLVGLHHYFLFVDPHIDEKAIGDYEVAMKEANKDAMNMLQTDDDFEEKMKEMEAKIKKEQAEKEAEHREAQAAIEAERQTQMAELKAQ